MYKYKTKSKNNRNLYLHSKQYYKVINISKQSGSLVYSKIARKTRICVSNRESGCWISGNLNNCQFFVYSYVALCLIVFFYVYL